MKQGALIFNEQTDRYDIRFDLADYYGGLHCGECLEVMVGGKWRSTRIEMAERWYLVGIRADDLILPCCPPERCTTSAATLMPVLTRKCAAGWKPSSLPRY